MEPDPLKEIREIRHMISKECDDDPEKVFSYYVAQQEKMKASGEYTFVSRPLTSNSATMATEQTHATEPPTAR